MASTRRGINAIKPVLSKSMWMFRSMLSTAMSESLSWFIVFLTYAFSLRKQQKCISHDALFICQWPLNPSALRHFPDFVIHQFHRDLEEQYRNDNKRAKSRILFSYILCSHPLSLRVHCWFEWRCFMFYMSVDSFLFLTLQKCAHCFSDVHLMFQWLFSSCQNQSLEMCPSWTHQMQTRDKKHDQGQDYIQAIHKSHTIGSWTFYSTMLEMKLLVEMAQPQ